MFEFIDFLSASPEIPPAMDLTVERYVAAVRTDVQKLVAEAEAKAHPSAAGFIAKYEQLPDAGRFHFLLSPAVYTAISNYPLQPIERFEALVKLLHGEHAVMLDAVPEGGDAEAYWSAMGDRALRRDASGDWNVWYAERVDSLTVLDFESPFATAIVPSSPMMYAPAEKFTDAERAAITEKVTLALEYVDAVAPKLGRMIRNYTRVIRFRKRGDGSDTGAEHVTHAIGEIRLLNAQSSRLSYSNIAENLIHESTHNVLSTYEYLQGHFVRESTNQYRPVSPWTGNCIPAHSICHAVFVWWALAEFAGKELERPDLSLAEFREIVTRRNTYAAGFLIPTKLSDSIRSFAICDPRILETIDETQRAVKASFTHPPLYRVVRENAA